jgi:lipid II:glycine glycyltransferase (peptidoglycan interpeptide bridge formation enzyme)
MARSAPFYPEVSVGRIEAVWSSRLSQADGEAYDAFVASARGGHFSQTRGWAPVATTANPFAARYFLARRDGRVVGAALILQTRPLGSLAIPVAQTERGPVCDQPEDMEDVLRALLQQSRRHGIVRLSVMPYWSGSEMDRVDAALKAGGFSDVQTVTGRHARALRLDLATVNQGEPFGGSSFTKLRKELRRAERAGAVARRGTEADLAAYREMLETRQRADGKSCPPDAYYVALKACFLSGDDRTAMFVAEYQDEVVAAVLALRHGTMTYFVAGVSSGRDLVFSKMIQPMAAAVLWAKENGSLLFDFGGMPMPGDRDPKRNSIALFKRSFSRDEVDLVHEHVRWF